jgi:hypothetical protein
MTSTRVAGVLLSGSVGLALVLSTGWAGFLYAVLFALAILPGLPIGFLIFGRGHAGGWIGGALIGYGLTQLALRATIEAGGASAGGFALAWLLLCAVVWLAVRSARSGPALTGLQWASTDTRALLLVLLLVPALMGPPYRNLGRPDEAGNRYYRAYFTADFLWHSALAYELGKFGLPPRNPYLAPRAMNYYWTYFLLPSTVAELSPVTTLEDVQRPLKANAMLIGLAMIGALFVLVRSAVTRPWAAASAVALAVVAASAEGLYEILDIMRDGRPFAALLDTNIDAVTAWQFGGLRIDNIPRSLWYTPQHTTAIALGLIALAIAAHAGARARVAAIAGAGLALGLATTMNPLIGAVCSLIYGICVIVHAVATPQGWKLVPRHVLAAVPVVLAVAWDATSRVMDGAGSVLDFGLHGFSRHSPVITLLLSLGPVLLPALPGVLGARADARRPVAIAGAGIALGLLLLYFVRISEASWVGFRAGQVLLVSIPILLARTLDRIGPRAGSALGALVLAIGLPTTVVDTWNAQDIGNRRPGPGFRWTLWVTPPQQEAFRWLRDHTPPDAIVQMEPMLRAREHWTLIPSFAGRRMAAGLPISLLPLPDYEQRSSMVRTLFATSDVDQALAIARRLRIDYLYVDQADAAAYPDGVRKFDERQDLFERVFADDDVRIYRVR